MAGGIHVRRCRGPVALLEEGHDPGFVGPEPGRIAPLTPLGPEFPVELGWIAVDPRARLRRWEVDPLGRRRHEGLEPVDEPGLPKDKIGHQAEYRGAEGVGLGPAVDRGLGGDAGATGPVGAFEDGDLVAGPPQVMRGDQAVDTGADYHHSLVHWGGPPARKPRHDMASNPAAAAIEMPSSSQSTSGRYPGKRWARARAMRTAGRSTGHRTAGARCRC